MAEYYDPTAKWLAGKGYESEAKTLDEFAGTIPEDGPMLTWSQWITITAAIFSYGQSLYKLAALLPTAYEERYEEIRAIHTALGDWTEASMKGYSEKLYVVMTGVADGKYSSGNKD